MPRRIPASLFTVTFSSTVKTAATTTVQIGVVALRMDFDTGAEHRLANEEQREGDDVHEQSQPGKFKRMLFVVPKSDAAAEQVEVQRQCRYQYAKQNEGQRRNDLDRDTRKEEGSTPDGAKQKQLQPGKTGHGEGI